MSPHFGLFIILRHLRNSRCKKDFLTSPFYQKAGHEISHEKAALCAPDAEEHSCHQRLGVDAKMNLQQKPTKISHIFH